MKKKVTDSKLFWEAVKSSLSDKSLAKDRINLIEMGEYIKNELKTVNVLAEFFSNIVTKLEMSQYPNYDPQIDNIEDLTLRAILKYKDHPSVFAIKNKCNNDVFKFFKVFIIEIEKEIRSFKTSKAS